MDTRIALVTGAGSGIGRASAVALAGAGWRVVLCGRTASSLHETVSAAGEDGGRMLVSPCDVSDAGEVDDLFAGIGKSHGRLDMVFNNAGTFGKSGNPAEISFETWRDVMRVNLDGAFLVARGAFAMMRDQDPQGGRIINNGSISAHVPRPGSAAYTASKHAITGLTKSIALDGRAFNIACSQIDIGNAASAMTDAMAKGVPQADGSVKPEPLMDVEHVARSIVHMASMPLDANVQFMTVMATAMPFIGRG